MNGHVVPGCSAPGQEPLVPLQEERGCSHGLSGRRRANPIRPLLVGGTSPQLMSCVQGAAQHGTARHGTARHITRMVLIFCDDGAMGTDKKRTERNADSVKEGGWASKAICHKAELITAAECGGPRGEKAQLHRPDWTGISGTCGVSGTMPAHSAVSACRHHARSSTISYERMPSMSVTAAS
jgi:hypothetical protein